MENQQQLITKLLGRRGISTRSMDLNNFDPTKRNKRKADASPLNTKVKRTALSNLTNNASTYKLNDKNIIKKTVRKKTDDVIEKTGTEFKNQNQKFILPPIVQQQQIQIQLPPQQQKTRATKILTRAAARIAETNKTSVTTITKPKEFAEVQQKPNTRRISNEFEKTEDSLYMSALDISNTSRYSGNFELSNSKGKKSLTVTAEESSIDDEECFDLKNAIDVDIPSPKLDTHNVPLNVIDFDRENWNDPFQVSNYAMDIFNYLKEREKLFIITDYMDKQSCLSRWMRSLLIDWMVEVQESFELNHETLYLAVKIVDIYLGKSHISKETLQLLGAAALFIASKFDERTPPLIDDFLYICDGAYKQKELIKMEMNVFRTIDFDLGIPLSYRFLRRYARCSKTLMPILTLARFILELSLMDYTTIQFSDSKMAAATLFIALQMNKLPGWNATLQYYSGYKVEEFAHIVPILNAGLHRRPKEALKTIRNKYSHKIFFEVSKIPLLTNEALFEAMEKIRIE